MKHSVVDLGISNLGSLLEAFRRIGADFELVNSPGDLKSAESVFLPGVGAFEDGMAAMGSMGLVEPLKELARTGTPLFGICLGMQMLFDESFENGRTKGLGILPGVVKKLEPNPPENRVPNMGWFDVRPSKARPGSRLSFASIDSFYFLHSYWCDNQNSEDLAATIDFGYPVTAAVEANNVCGVQFHPEKSQDPGLDLLANYIERLVELK